MKTASNRQQFQNTLRTSSTIAIMGSFLLLAILYEPTASIYSLRSSFFFSCVISALSGLFCFFLLFPYLLKQNCSPRYLRRIFRRFSSRQRTSMSNNYPSCSTINAMPQRQDDWNNNPGNPASPSYFGHFLNRSRFN
jgi:hypothetical protein